jgi:hypothetical protein
MRFMHSPPSTLLQELLLSHTPRKGSKTFTKLMEYWLERNVFPNSGAIVRSFLAGVPLQKRVCEIPCFCRGECDLYSALQITHFPRFNSGLLEMFCLM